MKLGIVLFNLGGPDSPEAVEPFLRNLFSDPAIITLPWIIRLPLARFIARRRAPLARPRSRPGRWKPPCRGQGSNQGSKPAVSSPCGAGTPSATALRGH